MMFQSHNVSFGNLPTDWASRETHTQTLGDVWLDECTALILVVPSVIIPIATAPDRNVLINHRHSGNARITITAVTPSHSIRGFSNRSFLLSHGSRVLWRRRVVPGQQ